MLAVVGRGAAVGARLGALERRLCPLALGFGALDRLLGAAHLGFGVAYGDRIVDTTVRAVVLSPLGRALLEESRLLVGDPLTLVGQSLALVGQLYPLVGQSLAFVGGGFPPVARRQLLVEHPVVLRDRVGRSSRRCVSRHVGHHRPSASGPAR